MPGCGSDQGVSRALDNARQGNRVDDGIPFAVPGSDSAFSSGIGTCATVLMPACHVSKPGPIEILSGNALWDNHRRRRSKRHGRVGRSIRIDEVGEEGAAIVGPFEWFAARQRAGRSTGFVA